MNGILRKQWSSIFQYNWVFGLFLILVFGIPRFALVLHSYVILNYGFVMLVFVVMWFVPFIFLTKSGRKYIGIKRPNHVGRLFLSFLLGALSCAVIAHAGFNFAMMYRIFYHL